MAIKFGDAPTPHYVATQIFHLGVLVGFLAVLAACVIIDKVANSMYHRGYARPFFLRGHRVHHFWIYLIVPISYLTVVALLLMGPAQLILNMVWYRLAIVVPIVAICVAIDFLGDCRQSRLNRAFLAHEWVYVVIPLYIFSYVINIYI